MSNPLDALNPLADHVARGWRAFCLLLMLGAAVLTAVIWLPLLFLGWVAQKVGLPDHDPDDPDWP